MQTSKEQRANRAKAKVKRDADRASFSPEIIALQEKESSLQKAYNKAVKDKEPELAKKYKRLYMKVSRQLQDRIKPLEDKICKEI